MRARLAARWIALSVALVLAVAVFTAPAGAVSGRPLARTPRAATKIDWPTYGGGNARLGYNPSESTLTPSTVGGVHKLWSAALGGDSISQPVLAKNIVVNGVATDVVYIGAEHGDFYAVNAVTGATIWHRNLGSVQTSCTDIPDGMFGISGTAVIDHGANLVYIVGGNGRLYALNLATGTTAPDWPVTITARPDLDHEWGAQAKRGSVVYVPTASYCDFGQYQGRVVAVNITTAQIVSTFYVTGKSSGVYGGGIWGYGGASIDRSTGSIFVATGNAKTTPESFGYGEHVVRLGAGLAIKDSNFPGVVGTDVDFGSTPLLYPSANGLCLTALNKKGYLYVYSAAALSQGPVQSILMGKAGRFIGVAAYSPATKMVYVTEGNGTAGAQYPQGAYGFSVQADCSLVEAWRQNAGATGVPSPPTVAGGILYYGDTSGAQVLAINAATGKLLWTSGTAIKGAIQGTPMVANGRLYVAAWDSRLYAFGL
jgi:outer membrane protein assembly factor BamB